MPRARYGGFRSTFTSIYKEYGIALYQKKSFSAAEISRIAGFSKPCMLNHLEREEIFVPDKARIRQHGKHRGYSFRDLIVLRAINRLLDLGALPKRIKVAIGTFEQVCPECNTDDLALAFARASGHFVVTPSEVFFCAAQEQLIDLLKGGQMSFSFYGGVQAADRTSHSCGYCGQQKTRGQRTCYCCST